MVVKGIHITNGTSQVNFTDINAWLRDQTFNPFVQVKYICINHQVALNESLDT